MSATMKPEQTSGIREPAPEKVAPYGSVDDLFVPPKTAEVEVNGKRFRFRELNTLEVERCSLATVKEETDAKGNTTRTSDMVGNRARFIAHSWIKADGSPMFPDPMAATERVNQLPRDTVETLFGVVDQLNGLSKERKDALGKGSGQTAGPASS